MVGRAENVDVGGVRDVVVKSEAGCGNNGMIEMRIFTPFGVAPRGEGWPVLVWLHGGELFLIF